MTATAFQEIDLATTAEKLCDELVQRRRAQRLPIDPEHVEQDLARLVLGIIEMLRQLMELQAIKRMEAGTLSEEQEEKLGTTLMRAEQAIHDVAAKFGLEPQDLSIDLGPLGRTI